MCDINIKHHTPACSYLALIVTFSNHSPAEWWELLRVVQERRRVVHFVRFWSLSTQNKEIEPHNVITNDYMLFY